MENYGLVVRKSVSIGIILVVSLLLFLSISFKINTEWLCYA